MGERETKQYAAMYDGRYDGQFGKKGQFGMMQVGYHHDQQIHLFRYWCVDKDKKGERFVTRTANWAGADEPCEGYEIFGEWDDAAEERFEAERQNLMVKHNLTNEPKREAKPTPVKRVEPLEREDGQMRLF